MQAGPVQHDLFGDEPLPLPAGMRYQAGFLSPQEERELLEILPTLPFEAMDYKGWKAQRRVVSWGGSYDFGRGRLEAREPIPDWLEPLRARVAAWAGREPAEFTQALASEYSPGTPLGWHRDVPDFEDVVGISLLGDAQMRLRPYPPVPGSRAELRLNLAPGSIYLLRGPVRWDWQHRIVPTPGLRYSITFRTPRVRAG